MSAYQYSQQLTDPRWQRKRLEIMARDAWRCQKCSDANSTLNVHHRWYLRGRAPWAYPDRALQTLCENCHAAEHGKPKHSGQSRAHSFFESICNVAVGYAVALGAQLLILPLYGVHLAIAQNVEISAIFTVISIARSYAIRRAFNRRF
jgi:hypothetical protein